MRTPIAQQKRCSAHELPIHRVGTRLRELPEPETQRRYGDEELYALALYVYSLKPPANPNLPKTAEQKARVERGEEI